MNRTNLRIYLPSIVTLLLGSQAWAVAFTPAEETTETMITVQNEDAGFLGRRFGGDDNSPIQFQTTIDYNAKSFSYQTAPGSTYLGQPLSILTSGQFNLGPNNWSITSAGSLGSQSWNTTGSGFWFGDPQLLFDFNTGVVGIPGTNYDFHVSGSAAKFPFDENNPGGAGEIESSFGASFTINGVKVAEAVFYDRVAINANGLPTGIEWNMPFTEVDGQKFRIRAEGVVPPGGGAGSTTVRIESTPEPSSILLMFTACGSLLWARRR